MENLFGCGVGGFVDGECGGEEVFGGNYGGLVVVDGDLWSGR